MAKKYPEKSKDVPATQGMLLEFRAEMNARFGSHDSRMSSLDSRMDSLDSRMDSLESKLDSRFEELKSMIGELTAQVHAANLKSEQQHAENRIVMESLVGITKRQDRVEMDTAEMWKVIRDLAAYGREH